MRPAARAGGGTVVGTTMPPKATQGRGAPLRRFEVPDRGCPRDRRGMFHPHQCDGDCPFPPSPPFIPVVVVVVAFFLPPPDSSSSSSSSTSASSGATSGGGGRTTPPARGGGVICVPPRPEGIAQPPARRGQFPPSGREGRQLPPPRRRRWRRWPWRDVPLPIILGDDDEAVGIGDDAQEEEQVVGLRHDPGVG